MVSPLKGHFHTPSLAFQRHSSKLCHNWLHHWRGTSYLRASAQCEVCVWGGGGGGCYICLSSLAPNVFGHCGQKRPTTTGRTMTATVVENSQLQRVTCVLCSGLLNVSSVAGNTIIKNVHIINNCWEQLTRQQDNISSYESPAGTSLFTQLLGWSPNSGCGKFKCCFTSTDIRTIY